MFQDGYCTTNQIIYIYYINHILIHILYQPAIDWGPFSSIFPRDFWIFQGPEKPHILWFLEWQGSNREDPMIKRINYPINISSSINIYIILYINIYIYNIYILIHINIYIYTIILYIFMCCFCCYRRDFWKITPLFEANGLATCHGSAALLRWEWRDVRTHWHDPRR